MKTLLLAAGRSRRVKPIEDKNLLKFLGWTLLEHQIMRLACVGLSDILLVVGAHNREAVHEVARAQMTLNPALTITLLEQANLEEGMAGALKAAEPYVQDEPLMIVSSNDVVDKEAYEAVKEALETGKTAPREGDAFLLAVHQSTYFPGGYLKLEDDNRIVGMVEKPEPGTEPSEWVNIVVHAHKNPRALFERLKTVQTQKDDAYEVAMDALMQEQIFKAVPYKGHWQPIKFPWHVLDLMQHALQGLKRHIHPTAQVAETAILRGEVVLEEGVKIFDHAVIQGPVYLGKNCIVGNNALVRESMIEEGSVIGFSTEVARSFIGANCWFHTNYVGDTVMGDNVSFGAGAICANLRLDEKNIRSGGLDTGRNKLGPILGSHIRVGVQTSLMPGIRIGSNTQITSGLVIAQDLEAGSFVSGKIELQISENRATLDPQAREKMKNHLPQA